MMRMDDDDAVFVMLVLKHAVRFMAQMLTCVITMSMLKLLMRLMMMSALTCFAVQIPRGSTAARASGENGRGGRYVREGEDWDRDLGKHGSERGVIAGDAGERCKTSVSLGSCLAEAGLFSQACAVLVSAAPLRNQTRAPAILYQWRSLEPS